MRIISFDIGIRNLAYCIMKTTPSTSANDASESKSEEQKTHPWSILTIEAWECVDVLTDSGCKAADCKKVSMDRVAQHVTSTLHRRENLFFKEPIDYILVERQVRKAPRNMMTSMAVLCYFLNYNLHQSPEHPVQIPRPVLVSAAGKLSVNVEPACFASNTAVHHFANDKSLNASQNKTRRKNKAIELCKTILDFTPSLQSWKSFFIRGKKDDKADSFLQGLYYLQNIMPTKPTRKKRKRNEF